MWSVQNRSRLDSWVRKTDDPCGAQKILGAIAEVASNREESK
jgi:hypothetical protein